MKQLLLFFLAVMLSYFAKTQTVNVYHENFESPSNGDSVSSSTVPAGGTDWTLTSNLAYQGAFSDSMQVQTGKIVYLTTTSMSTVGKTVVYLKFAQICKVFYGDGGYIEVSPDGGTTWVPLTGAHYKGSGMFTGNRFSESSYVSDWSSDGAAIPNNAWWKQELFDISVIAANKTDVKVRFKLADGATPGGDGRYGWLIDDINVLASNNELDPPVIALNLPNYGDTVYTTGPFPISATVTDQNSISATLYYSVNGGSEMSIPMTNISSIYNGEIPSFTYNNNICWRIEASDNFGNISHYPTIGCNSFLILRGNANVQVGTGTIVNTNTAFPTPYGMRYTGSKEQYLILASELQSLNAPVGKISSIAFDVVTPAPVSSSGSAPSNTYLKDYTIKIGTTNENVLSTAWLTGLTQVYYNPMYVNTAGWNVHPFTVDFIWDGTSNIVIETCFDKYVTASDYSYNAQVNQTATSFISSHSYRSDAGGVCPSTSNSATASQRPNIKINFLQSNESRDAGITQISQPIGIVETTLPHSIKIRLKNFGTDTLKKVTVNWALDEVGQGSYNWIGSLTQDVSSSLVTIGNINVPAGSHILKVWTSLPNDSADLNALNDTLKVNLYGCSQILNGTYTVGNASANFTTFADLMNVFSNCGVSGTVTIKIKPGTYNQQLVLSAFPGVSSTNRVIFESETGDKSSVVFTYSAQGTNDNYVIKLDNANYFTIRNISVKPAGAANGYGIVFDGTSSYNVIESNLIEMPMTSSNTYAGIYDGTAINNYNIFRNNIVKNGYYGIYSSGGSSSSLQKGSIIEGNIINGFYYYGIYSNYQDSVVINSNIIENGSNAGVAYGIYAGYNDNLLSISKNKIYVHTSGTSANYGIYVYYCDNTATQPGIISNNFISQSGTTGSIYGIDNYYSTYQKYLYNSVNITSGSTTGGAFYSTNGSNIDLYNNIFSNTGGGYAYYIGTTSAIVNSNYNDIYTTGTNLAYWSGIKTSLAALKTASSKDVNSISVNPNFASLTDLHLNNSQLNNLGTPLAEVLTDIDGNNRNAATPDIGADEFDLIADDAGVVAVVEPGAPCAGVPAAVVLKIKNFGLSPLTSAEINWEVDGILQTPYTFNGNLNTLATADITVGNYTFNSGQFYTIKAWSKNPNGLVDQNNINDTVIENTIQTSLSGGTYTVGTQASDFATINDAISQLQSKGVCGSVVLNIAPGTYTVNAIIPLIIGTSSSNKVIFQSATGNKSDVVLKYEALDAASNYVLRLDGCNNIVLRNLTLKTTGASYGRVIELTGGANNISIDSCSLEMPVSTSSNYSGVYSSTTIENNNIVSNCEIINGYYGISFAGTSTTSETGNKFINNKIIGFYYYGLNLSYQDSCIVNNNTLISASASSTTLYGIYASNVIGRSEFQNNKIQMIGAGTGVGIYLNACTSTLPKRITIANNFVSQSDGSTYQNTGISLNASTNVQVFYNSVNITSPINTSRAFYLTGGSGVRVLNNIFSNTGAGYSYYNATPTAIDSSDYNDLYAPSGSKFAYWGSERTGLATLQTVSNKDQHSISIDPNFPTTHSYNVNNPLLNGVALPLPEISKDIAGTLRNSTTPDIGAFEFNIRQNDAGIISYTSSLTPCSGGGSLPISVKLKNFGTLPLSSISIEWSVNDVLQTPFTFAGGLAYTNDSIITIGSYPFVSFTTDTIKVWTSSSQDEDHLNDTLSTVVVPRIAPGNYVISNTIGADFSSFNAAINAINQYGLCGHVVFDVAPGTYDETLTIGQIPTSGPNATVTFRSQNGDSTSVILTNSTGSYVVKLTGADYVRFEKMTIKATSSVATVIEISDGSDYNIFNGNVLELEASSSSSSSKVINSASSLDNYNQLTNNLILGGYYGIYNYGSSSSSLEKGNRVEGNIVKNFYYYGIYSNYQDSTVINSNVVENGTNSGTVYGIYAGYNDNLVSISKNKVYVHSSGTSTNYGIYIYYCDNTSTQSGIISNNFVSQSGTSGSIYGIDNYYSTYQKYLYNSVNITSGSTTGGAFYSSGGSNVNVYNNTFSNTGVGYAYYVGTTSAIVNSNYNNIYSAGTNVAYWSSAKVNLAALQLASGKDVNSISINPQYFSISDLHTDNPGLYAKGLSITEVTDDIDGQQRPTTPCIGADEYTIPANDAALLQMYTYGKLPKNAGTPHNVKAILVNKGQNTLYNLPALLSVSGANSFTNTVVLDSLRSGEQDTVIFDNYNPTILGDVNVKVSLPLDDILSNNELSYKQVVTDSLFGYADTSAVATSLGIGSAGEGYFVSKYHINSSRNVSAVKAFITASNTIGQRLYAVVMDSAGIIIDTSASKIITAQDTMSWVSFIMSNPVASNVINKDLYVGIAQTIGTTGSYYPLGCQKENYCRAKTFYYSSGLATINLVNTVQFGRFMIEAELGYPNNNDASVVSILSPVSKCNASMEEVKINILNVGTDTIYGGQNVLTAHYGLRLNGNIVNVVSQVVTDTIFPANSKVFTFISPVNMVVTTADSNYNVVAWVDLLNDPYQTNDTLTKSVTSKFTPPTPGVTNPVNINFGVSATLSATSNDSVYWYADVNDTIPIASGGQFITPLLYDTTTYYVAAGQNILGGTNVGMNSSSTGATSGAGTTNFGLVFDALSAFTLRSVTVYPVSASNANGTVTIDIVNSSGTVLHTATANVTGHPATAPVPYTIDLNFTVAPGTGLKMRPGFTGISGLLFEPAAVAPSGGYPYPYVIPGVVSINFSTLTATNTPRTDLYYYFYNWDVIAASSSASCQSPRVPVVVNVAPGSDASVTSILSPNSGCGLSNQSVNVRIKNRGNIPIIGSQNTLTAHYGLKLNGNIINVVNELVPNTILAGDSLDFTFATPLTLAANNADSNYTLVAWNTLVNDLFVTNDTTSKGVISKYTPIAPTVAGTTTVTFGNSATFNIITTDSISWFASVLDTVPIATGSNFVTPPLYDTTTYYAMAGVSNGSGSSQFVGPADNTIGAGGAANYTTYQQIFDVLHPQGVTIKKVDMYPGVGAGAAYTMVILNSSGTTIASYSGVTTVTSGTKETVSVDFFVPQGTGYKIGFTAMPDLYRNSGGAVYPYTIPGVISITGNTFSSGGDYWYYIYNWEVSTGTSSISSCTSPKVPATVVVTNIPALDVAATAITEPLDTIVTGALTSVKAVITNYGTNTVTSATIKWSVNGIAQPDVPWSGSLTSGQASSIITLGSYAFAGGPSIIKVWTRNPNGATDMFPANDTVKRNVMGCFTGTFTIGNGGTFPTFNAAISAVNTVGVCGNVFFDVLPGTYDEVLTINQIPTTGSNATITFRSQNGDSTSVTLTSSTGSYVVKLNGADYIRFEKMTIKATSSVATVVEISGGSDYNIFKSNVLELGASPTFSTSRVINNTGTADNYNQILNNRISGGYYGIYNYGVSTSSLEKGSKIEGNIVKDFYYYGIYSYYQDSTVINSNIVENGANSGVVYGINASYNDNLVSVSKNKVYVHGSGTSANYGIYINYCDNTSAQPGLISNNFVTQSGTTGSIYGIVNYYSTYHKYIHNSVNITSGSTTGGAFYSTSGSNIDVYNNIFVNTGGGYAYYVGTTSAILNSDYNDIYANGTNLAYWGSAQADLINLKTTSGKDLNSISIDPNFNSMTDLHIVNFDINGKATPIALIADDIDGDVRNTIKPDIGADEFNLPANDAGIMAIISPFNSSSTGTHGVRAVIRNFGNDNLVSANVQWSVNGIAQPSFIWSGNLVSGDTISAIIGNYNFTQGTSTIKAWTNQPNGSIDGIHANDTAIQDITICSGPLAGIYTIGGSSANFPTINAAVNSLRYCGVSASVTFNINPGTYNEQVVIDYIPGTSSVNTVVFKSANNDSNSVVISYAPASSTANYVLKLSSTYYVQFKNISIVNATQSNFGRVVELSNGSSYNTIEGCRLEMPVTTSSNYAGIYSPNTIDQYNTFKNNLILNGYYGIYNYGTNATTLERGNKIEGNIIKGFYYYGIYSYYQDSAVINSNVIENGSNSGTVYGISAGYNDNLVSVSKNKVYVHGSGTSANYGIYIYYCDNTSSQLGVISNNFVSQSGTSGSIYGIANYYSSYQKYLYNSVNITSGSTTGGAFYSTNGSNIDLYNNIFSNTGVGYAYYIGTTSAIENSNYNNIYATGASLAYWGAAVTDLAALKTASGKDLNSVSVNPDYISIADLHVYTPALNNLGTPLSEVVIDIDGQPRSITTPDIGADEFTPLPIDIGVKAIYEPTISYAQVGAHVPIKVIVKNYGANDVIGINVGYKLGNGVPVMNFINDTLSSNETDTFTLANPLAVIQGANMLSVYTVLATDANHLNDTVSLTFNGVPVVVAPFHDNFDLTTTDWMTLGGNSDWEHGAPNSSVINTAHSAPYVWKTKLNGNYNNDGTYILYSPIFSSGQFQMDTLKFWMWMDAEVNQDGGRIEYLNGQGIWKILGVSSDTNGVNWYNATSQNMWTGQTNGWQEVKYELQSVNDIGLNTQFRFIFTSNATNNANGWAIDDFVVTLKMIDQDGGVVAIIKPQTTQNTGDQVSPKVTLKNFGINPLTSIPVKYSVNGNVPVTETWTGNLAPGATVDFQLASLFAVHTQNIAFCAYTAVIGDIYTGNDSLCMTVNVQPAQNDAGISQIVGLDQATQFTNVPVTAVIKNYGSAPLTSVPVKYQRGAAAIVSEIWTGAALAYGDSVVYTFTQQLQVPAGSSFNLCVWTDLANDQYASNDKVCKNVQIIVGVGETENSLFTLGQNIPNPSRGNTLIPFELKESGKVQFRLINQLGQQLFESENYFDLGKHQIDLNTENYPAGIYFYSIEFKGKRLLNKMIIE